jgi:hypothetical protein
MRSSRPTRHCTTGWPIRSGRADPEAGAAGQPDPTRDAELISVIGTLAAVGGISIDHDTSTSSPNAGATSPVAPDTQQRRSP